MQNTFEATRPYKATILFKEYVSRGANRQMQSVMSDYSDVSISEAQEKFKVVLEAKEEDRLQRFKLIDKRELEAITKIQEALVYGMIEKITNEEGEQLDKDEYEQFLDGMTDAEFGEMSQIVSNLVVEQKQSNQKKTKK
jgi:hypothetical protein